MTEEPVFHETQRLSLCAVHACNNLLQRRHFAQKHFDDMCLELAPGEHIFNPHRSMLRLGNFDINVVMALLQKEAMEVTWHDKREELTVDVFREKEEKELVGILWNVPSESVWGRLWRSRHWIALRKYQGQWMNLDSNLKEPTAIGSDDDCIHFLKSPSRVQETHVLFVHKSKREND